MVSYYRTCLHGCLQRQLKGRRVPRSTALILSVCLFLVFAFGGIASLAGKRVRPPSFPLTDPDPVSFNRPLIVGTQNYTQLSFDMPYESAWRQHAHLVVFGVLATDKPERQELRNSQRSSWLRYPDVAKRSNAFEGLMLVLYAVAPYTTMAPNISLSLADEMHTHHDVLVLRMKEEAPTKVKVVGAPGGYGLSVQVSNARKRFFYMLYVYNTFPGTPFIAKGDDDIYLHVPEYLRMVRQLPRINTIYGTVTKDKPDYPDHPRRTTLGIGYTVSRDILHDTVQDSIVNVLLLSPYADELTAYYMTAYYRHEDATIGKTMERVYGVNGTARRALPDVPVEDSRLPAVEGWGKAYMAYVRDPHKVPHMGRATNYDGRYNVTFSFPPPSIVHPGNVLWVSDVCRMNNRRHPSAEDKMRLILAHRTTLAEQLLAYWVYNHQMGEDAKMLRPHHIEVKDEEYFNDVTLMGLGECKIYYST